MELKVLVHPAEEGGYWAEAPALPGCVSEGETLDETLANIREAAGGWLEVAADRASAASPIEWSNGGRKRHREHWHGGALGDFC
jgi:predicted RNase H-like HicB family nuclease